MDSVLHDKLNSATWAAHGLFQRGRTTGFSANMSFRHNNLIYINASGFCFGTMSEEDFIAINLDGTPVSSRKPSKEWPLYLTLYKKSEDIGAMTHTHGTCSVLWTFVPNLLEHGYIPDHALYLKMKLGTVGLVPYEKLGSDALFTAFREHVRKSRGYLLGNHGPIMPGKTIMGAFYYLEELEENARVVWELYRTGLHHL